MTTKELLDEYGVHSYKKCDVINKYGMQVCNCDGKQKIKELEASIRKEVLEDLYKRNRNHEPSEEKEMMFRDDLEKLAYICGRVDIVNDIRKYALSKGITLN